MAETSSSAGANATIDLRQFYQVFFEEAAENLEKMEELLLSLDIAVADDEELNAVFRCAHSIKGGAATFGFADVAQLTHEMETLLDKLRRREIVASAGMVDVLLAAGDALRGQLARHRGAGGASSDISALLAGLRAFTDVGSTSKKHTHGGAGTVRRAMNTGRASAAPDEDRHLELLVGPLMRPEDADDLVDLFREIAGLGQIESLDSGIATDGMRRFRITTTSSDDDLLDLFTFHVAREQVKLTPAARGGGEVANEHENAEQALADPGYGFFNDAPGAPQHAIDASPSPSQPAPLAAKPVVKADKPTVANESSTLRVSVEKVDQLINLMGELVITQAMLAQNSKSADDSLNQHLAAGLAALDRNTRDLQEAVMSIRMIPMSIVFSRFPRMVRDLAAKLGKKVEFVTVGEATELDKGLVEKITDPLTHLVRNSCDHGIELPAERLAAGKSATGTITLSAAHQGGSIAIEVRDDGKGLSRRKLLTKARQRGIHAPDSMSDQEVWNLIFSPGFSTVDVVTDLSGRGVGMDVVKRNITALGGSVEIDSAEGYGMRVSVRLPLTLAIMDGMSVGVGNEVYILPLSSVVESLQVRADTIKTIGGSGRVVQVRGEYMPVLDLEQVFNVPRLRGEYLHPIMVVVEAEAGRVVLLVDELLGQQQVVVKNLEANYRKVSDVSGATIMGDGRVALILDVASLVRRSRH